MKFRAIATRMTDMTTVRTATAELARTTRLGRSSKAKYVASKGES